MMPIDLGGALASLVLSVSCCEAVSDCFAGYCHRIVSQLMFFDFFAQKTNTLVLRCRASISCISLVLSHEYRTGTVPYIPSVMGILPR